LRLDAAGGVNYGREAVGPVMAVAREAADARFRPASASMVEPGAVRRETPRRRRSASTQHQGLCRLHRNGRMS